jgi:hypothetical protein
MEYGLKRLARLLIIIFALNVVAEMSAGHCREICSAGQSQIQTINSKAFVSSPSQHQLPTHQKDVHVCHLGHCSHVTVVATKTILACVIRPAVWAAQIESSIWRNLAPLLKPPIA